MHVSKALHNGARYPTRSYRDVVMGDKDGDGGTYNLRTEDKTSGNGDWYDIVEVKLMGTQKPAKFGAEVTKESARNEKIAKKSLKAKSRAYAYALPCLGRHVLAGIGPYQWPHLCL
ncbi:hypothetical protein PIB30_062450 [Stylosanthes scabra]|uniref:Uncharacterized protein n=1 Tax=Stylosanthes scabra TaxID=79078 RepID=A0ABU6SL76_9FABA|nr:hypothetical protein [Stylosanthes scabra]